MHSQTTPNPYKPCSFPSVNASLASAVLPTANKDQLSTYGSLICPTSIKQQSSNTFSFGSFPPLHNTFTSPISSGLGAETDPHSVPLNNNICPSAGPHLGMPLMTTTLTGTTTTAESAAASTPDTNIISSSAQPNEVTRTEAPAAATTPQPTAITTPTAPNATTGTTAILAANTPAAGTATSQAPVTSEITTTTTAVTAAAASTSTVGSNNSEFPAFTATLSALELLLRRQTEMQSEHHSQLMEVMAEHRRMMAEFTEHRRSNNVSYPRCLLIYSQCLFLYFQ